jgi:pyridoxine 5'-phosphate synthase PdxJ
MFYNSDNTANQGSQVQSEINEEQKAYTQGTKVGVAFSTGVTDKLTKFEFTDPFKWMGTQLESVFKFENIAQRARILDKEATNIRNTLGLGVERGREFEVMVRDNASRFAEMGLEVEKVKDTFNKLSGEYQTTVSLTNEELTEIAATARVTGQDVSALAKGFRGVGISIIEVGDRMEEVVKVAKSAGVSVAAVSAGVLANLDKMNIYNFEGGVKGLAKMSAQAARLGVDMSKIFSVVDKVFNPEGAIELAAGLQRLGVSANALLDPLRLMDLSQNDPAELQNQIIEMSKDFVRFNKQLGQFEILPGEKRRLNEIGKELGMANGELQKMALNAADFDRKLQQIKFPEGIASKEDRELIATMATINKEGIAEVKVKQIDETGKWTGEYDVVEASQLTTDQIKLLAEDQKGQAKTMEELAREQLDQTTRLNAKFDQFFKAVAYGVAGSNTVKAGYDLTTTTVREFLFKDKETDKGLIGEPFNRSKTYSMATDMTADQVKKMVSEVFGSTDFKDIGKKIMEGAGSLLPDELKTLISNFDLSSLTSGLTSGFDKLKSLGSSFGIGGSETDPLSNITNATNILNTNVENQTKQLTNITNMSSVEFKPLTIDEKIKVDFNVTLDPSIKNQTLSELMTAAITQYFEGGDSKVNVAMVLDALQKEKTTQGLIPAKTETKSTISAPGMTT